MAAEMVDSSGPLRKEEGAPGRYGEIQGKGDVKVDQVMPEKMMPSFDILPLPLLLLLPHLEHMDGGIALVVPSLTCMAPHDDGSGGGGVDGCSFYSRHHCPVDRARVAHSESYTSSVDGDHRDHYFRLQRVAPPGKEGEEEEEEEEEEAPPLPVPPRTNGKLLGPQV